MTGRKKRKSSKRKRRLCLTRFRLVSTAISLFSVYMITVMLVASTKLEYLSIVSLGKDWDVATTYRKKPTTEAVLSDSEHPTSQHRNGAVIRNLSSGKLPYNPPFGFVMRDFARRVLSRKISNSNVLVIAPDAMAAAQEAASQQDQADKNENPYDSIDFHSHYSVGGTFLLHAFAENHTIHAFNVGYNGEDGLQSQNHSLDTWWSSFGSRSLQRRDPWWSSEDESKPKWIIAALIDLPIGYEDLVWTDAEVFLRESTTTYFVVGIHCRKTDDGFMYGGLEGMNQLLGQRYKLQVLLSSHYHVIPGQEKDTANQFGPNALLQSLEQVKTFLRWGAEAADNFSTPELQNDLFTAYIFATQGLDLAIPSSRIFLNERSRVVGDESTTQINLYKPLEFTECRQRNSSRLEIEFGKLLGESSIRVAIRLENSTYQIRQYHRLAPQTTGFTYEYKENKKHAEGPKPEDLSLWFDGESIDSSEAACVKLKNEQSKCTTRIRPDRRRSFKSKEMKDLKRPNILLILLDPMSRPHFHRSMPMTASMLENLGFTHFTNYSAVGSNSGPNQAALYSGIPLAGRNGIKKTPDHDLWLWDRLRSSGYKTLKAEDGCIENSNMLQSLDPNTTHGKALYKMFCFDFDRPNCVGPELASNMLARYGIQFTRAYEEIRRKMDPMMRWAAFIHFIDSHEDTMLLSSAIDSEISNFLEKLNDDGTLSESLVVFTSDHGLHYGSYFQSRSGRREATEPLLYMKVPSSLQQRFDMEVFSRNAKLWVTPFDVHETIVAVTTNTSIHTRERKGSCLFAELPTNRASCYSTEEIPKEYCDLHSIKKEGARKSASCTKMPRPPSILSFFADIPKDHRTQYTLDCKKMANAETSAPKLHKQCQCATSHREWYRCDDHPWGKEEHNAPTFSLEYFALMKCKGKKMSIDTRVIKNDALLTRSKTNLRTLGVEENFTKSRPNILFIEVDSVSLAYADRHFPLTRSLLREHRMEKGSNDDINCKNGICAADFDLFSLVGPNSISNQITAMSGCLVTRFHDDCFTENSMNYNTCTATGKYIGEDGACTSCQKGTFLLDPLEPCYASEETCCTGNFPQHDDSRVCNNLSRFEHDLQLFRRGPRRHTTWCDLENINKESAGTSPWLFDVSKLNGYITSFGDEFCYENSPFVAQDNVFPLLPDFELHRLYCRLEESKQYKFDSSGPELCARLRSNQGHSLNPGFDLVNNIWAAYPDSPKFIYLNAMAAHDYSDDWLMMTSAAEEYDKQLAEMIGNMMGSETFQDTVIIVRADHGLQGGPSTVDYSMQVEHREPWVQIILPKEFPNISLTSLYDNQKRVVTGFDLYSTLRMLIEGDSKVEGTVPKWSYNLLQKTVPRQRTCSEAKVPVEFCPCEEQVFSRPPTFGVCNPFDQYGDLYCGINEEVILPDILET